MTYRELDEAANRLAHLLAGQVRARVLCGAAGFPVRRGGHRDAGGAQDRGGVSADRTGAAGGPDASSCSPTPRRSPRSPPPVWPGDWTGATWLVIDVEDPRVDSYPARHRRRPAADDIAYLIYTSGTTGKPEGGGDHPPQRDPPGGATGHGFAAPGQVWTQCHSYAFDFSVLGDLGCAAGWRAAGGGARIGGGAHRKTSTPCWSPNKSTCSPRPPRRWRRFPRRVWIRWRCWWAVRPARPSWWIGGRPGGW